MKPEITFRRLFEIDPTQIMAHMSAPRVAAHMPLLKRPWNDPTATNFIAEKEASWARDGLGQWAIFYGSV